MDVYKRTLSHLIDVGFSSYPLTKETYELLRIILHIIVSESKISDLLVEIRRNGPQDSNSLFNFLQTTNDTLDNGSAGTFEHQTDESGNRLIKKVAAINGIDVVSADERSSKQSSCFEIGNREDSQFSYVNQRLNDNYKFLATNIRFLDQRLDQITHNVRNCTTDINVLNDELADIKEVRTTAASSTQLQNDTDETKSKKNTTPRQTSSSSTFFPRSRGGSPSPTSGKKMEKKPQIKKISNFNDSDEACLNTLFEAAKSNGRTIARCRLMQQIRKPPLLNDIESNPRISITRTKKETGKREVYYVDDSVEGQPVIYKKASIIETNMVLTTSETETETKSIDMALPDESEEYVVREVNEPRDSNGSPLNNSHERYIHMKRLNLKKTISHSPDKRSELALKAFKRNSISRCKKGKILLPCKKKVITTRKMGIVKEFEMLRAREVFAADGKRSLINDTLLKENEPETQISRQSGGSEFTSNFKHENSKKTICNATRRTSSGIERQICTDDFACAKQSSSTNCRRRPMSPLLTPLNAIVAKKQQLQRLAPHRMASGASVCFANSPSCPRPCKRPSMCSCCSCNPCSPCRFQCSPCSCYPCKARKCSALRACAPCSTACKPCCSTSCCLPCKPCCSSSCCSPCKPCSSSCCPTCLTCTQCGNSSGQHSNNCTACVPCASCSPICSKSFFVYHIFTI